MIEEQYYNIIERTDYWIKIEHCKNLEKLSDSFITKSDLQNNYVSNGYNIRYNASKIRNIMQDWIDLVKPDQISDTKPPLHVQAMLEGTDDNCLINKILPNEWVVHGNRLINTRKQSKRAQELKNIKIKEALKRYKEIENAPYERPQHIIPDDLWNIKYAINEVIEEKYYFTIQLIRVNRINNITGFKALCNWREVEKQLRIVLPTKQHKEDIKFAKQLWLNPEATIGANHD